MELRSRIEKLVRPQPPIVPPPPSDTSARLVSMERDVSLLRWLRGGMCYLVCITYALSLFQIDSYPWSVVLHVFMLLLSLSGEACIFFIYRIKARFSGITNAAATAQASPNGRPQRSVSVLHSPYAGRMVVEMVLWVVQSPPGLRSTSWANILDSLILLRCYVFFLYFTQFTSRQEFKRIIAAACGFRFDSSYLLRNSYLSASSSPVIFSSFVAIWLGLALLYSKAEGTVDFNEALYVCFTSASFVGYGDYIPATGAGRIAIFFCWVMGVVVVLWCTAILYRVSKISPAERNLYMLFQSNKLCASIPGEAARTIQRAWKLYKAKRDGASALSRQLNALLLSSQAISFRALRRSHVAAELNFLRATVTFEDAMAAMTPATTPRASPAGTPRRRYLYNRETRTKKAAGSAAAQTPPGVSTSSSKLPTPKTRERSAEAVVAPLSVPAMATAVAEAAQGISMGSDYYSGSVADIEVRMKKLELTMDSIIASLETAMGMDSVQAEE